MDNPINCLDGTTVVVMRVFHTSQHPKKKLRRKRK